jgi:hypothetical protein
MVLKAWMGRLIQTRMRNFVAKAPKVAVRPALGKRMLSASSVAECIELNSTATMPFLTLLLQNRQLNCFPTQTECSLASSLAFDLLCSPNIETDAMSPSPVLAFKSKSGCVSFSVTARSSISRQEPE